MRLTVGKVLAVLLAVVLVFTSAAPVMAAKTRAHTTTVKTGGKTRKHKHRKHKKLAKHVKHARRQRHKKKN